MKRKTLSLITRFTALFMASLAFFQFAALLEGNSSMLQTLLVLPLCGGLSYALTNLDKRLAQKARRRAIAVRVAQSGNNFKNPQVA